MNEKKTYDDSLYAIAETVLRLENKIDALAKRLDQVTELIEILYYNGPTNNSWEPKSGF